MEAFFLAQSPPADFSLFVPSLASSKSRRRAERYLVGPCSPTDAAADAENLEVCNSTGRQLSANLMLGVLQRSAARRVKAQEQRSLSAAPASLFRSERRLAILNQDAQPDGATFAGGALPPTNPKKKSRKALHEGLAFVRSCLLPGRTTPSGGATSGRRGRRESALESALVSLQSVAPGRELYQDLVGAKAAFG